MSPRLIIAAQSGVVIGLLGLVLYQARQLRIAQRELGVAVTTPLDLNTNFAQRTLRLRLQQLPPINLPTRVEQLDWRSVESADYPTYVANLRAVGCPEATIRDIIVADVNKLYADRRRALAPATADWEFWRHPSEVVSEANPSDAAQEREAAEQDLESERRRLIATLLGPGALKAELEEYASEAATDRSLQFLPAEKRTAVAEVQARYRQATEALQDITDPEEQAARTTAATKAYEEAISAALTPEEREQYEMRSGSLAAGLREKLRGFGASREEFQTLYRLEDNFAKERGKLESALASGEDPQAALKLEAAEIELQQKMKETLGPQRFSDFQRAQDPDYQTLYSLTTEHEMSPAIATQVYDMRNTVRQLTDRIRENPLLTADQKIRAFEAIRAETESSIVDVMGEPLLQEYSRQGGGWLLELTDTRNLGETDAIVVEPPLPEIEGLSTPVPNAVEAPRLGRFRRNR